MGKSSSVTVGKFYVALLLVCTAAGYCSLEVLFHIWSRQYSQGIRSLTSEYSETLSLRPRDSQSDLPTILLAGNSLLQAGVDLGQLQKSLSTNYRIQRLAIPATTYEDWHYILNDIFLRGARPQYVVLLMSPSHLSLKYPIPDLAAVNVYRGRDLWRVASEQHLDLNDTVMLYITHYSPFWGARESIRTLKQRILPGYAIALRDQSRGMTQKYSEVQVDPRRIEDLASVCGLQNSHFILVIPPTDQPVDSKAVPQVLSAAAAMGVTALFPVESSNLDRSYYTDGLHLNAEGAQVFTAALAHAIHESIQSSLVVVNRMPQTPSNSR
jgi:hypothetical protein